METALTDAKYWIDAYEDMRLVAYDADNQHFKLLFQYLHPTKPDSVLEIGSYPGPFLAALGAFGCELNGIDIHPANSNRLSSLLCSLGFRVGDVVTRDFLHFAPGRKFDLVYSLGFLEHFRNYEEVIRRHAKLVNAGGFLFLSTPNFAGVVQRWLKRSLDAKNLEQRFLPSMDPLQRKAILEAEGCDILHAGYFGGIGFWVDDLEPRSRLNRLIAGGGSAPVMQTPKSLAWTRRVGRNWIYAAL